MNDVLLNKAAVIERCIERINEEFSDDAEFRANHTRQDSVILNLQRACEAAIDIANYLIKKNSLGIPQSARDSFDLLTRANLLDESLALNLKSMVGLRNIAVHNYQQLNMEIVVAVISNRLGDLRTFAALMLAVESERDK